MIVLSLHNAACLFPAMMGLSIYVKGVNKMDRIFKSLDHILSELVVSLVCFSVYRGERIFSYVGEFKAIICPYLS